MPTSGSSLRLLLAFFTAILSTTAFAPEATAQQFIRGDANGDGAVDIGDPIRILGFLFSGSDAPLCASTGDANDDGAIDIGDPIAILGFLFSNSGPLPAPFPACDVDPTPDSLNCTIHAPCGTFPPLPEPPILDPHDAGTTALVITISGVSNGVTVRVASPIATFEVPVNGGAFTATNIPLDADSVNAIYFSSIDSFGSSSSQVATLVTQDLTPPQLVITAPTDGQTIATETVVVSGLVQDLLSDLETVTVLVNGAAVSTSPTTGGFGAFTTEVGPLTPADISAITIEGTDALGNSSSTTIEVTYIVPSGPRLALLSGGDQTGEVLTELGDPLVYQVTQSDGSPFANKLVELTVSSSDGQLLDAPGGPGAFSTSLLTDAQGQVSAYWRLGGGVGSGAQAITATSSGVEDVITTLANAIPAPPDKISVSSGNSQLLEVEGEAPGALTVRVTDLAGNAIAGVPVIFTSKNGTSKVRAEGLPPAITTTVLSDAAGQASVHAILGKNAGNYRFTSSFAGNPSIPAEFNLTGIARDLSQPTRFEGVALSNANQPIEGASVRLSFPGAISHFTTTDAQGLFSFSGFEESGPARLDVDGLAATSVSGSSIPAGSFPCLEFQVLIVPNARNELGMPALLPPLNPLNATPWDGGVQDLTLTMLEMPGVQMLIEAGTVILDKDGVPLPAGAPIALNPVHSDKIPMPLPDGSFSPFAWTLQPAGMHFDPPVAVKLPNFLGRPAGAALNLVSFNHSTHRFESFGTGTVSANGATIESDPGFGIVVSGWGAPLPPPPPPAKVQNCAGGELWPLLQDAQTFVLDLDTALDQTDEALQCAAALATAATDAQAAWATIAGDGVLDPSEVTTILDLLSALNDLDCTNLALTVETGGLAASVQQVNSSLGSAIAASDLEGCLGTALTAAQNAAGALLDWVAPVDSLTLGVESLTTELIGGDVANGNLSAAISAAGGTPTTATLDTIDALFAQLLGHTGTAGGSSSALQPIIDDQSTLGLLSTNLSSAELSLETNPELAGATISIAGQTVIANACGGFSISNIPSGSASLRIEVVSEDGGTTQFAQSDCIVLAPNECRLIPPLTLGPQPLDVIGLSVSVDPPTIEVGQTGQITVLALLTDGSSVDVTTNACVSYSFSVVNYSGFDPATGLISAILPGNYFITVLYDGAVSGVAVQNTISIPPTTDVLGFVQLSSGAPVNGALVSLGPSGLTAMTDSTGFYFFPDVLANQGDFVIDVNSGAAISAAITPVPDGVTDAGISYITSGTELFVLGATGAVGSIVTTNLVLDTETILSGWSVGLCNDPLMLQAIDVWAGITTTTAGEDGDFVDFQDLAVSPSGVTQGVVISLTGQSTLPVGSNYSLLTAQYELGGASGSTQICVCDTAGAVPVQTVLVNVGGLSIPVGQNCGTVTITP